MRHLIFSGLLLGLLQTTLYGGQIYGSVISGGRGVAGGIEINCGGVVTRGGAAGDGSYRINVPQKGKCTLTLLDYPGASADVFSYGEPRQYDFNLEPRKDGRYDLRGR
ncbi:MAG TPA: hypothetical protein VE422_32735 [Terriglobia bacterium]|nr:hypothetical protein [Terriglobia bacterium]